MNKLLLILLAGGTALYFSGNKSQKSNTTDKYTTKTFPGYKINGCISIVVFDEKAAKEYAFQKGKSFIDGKKLLKDLFGTCYENLEISEPNVVNTYTLLSYGIAGAYFNKKLELKNALTVLNNAVEDYQANNIILDYADENYLNKIIEKMTKK